MTEAETRALYDSLKETAGRPSQPPPAPAGGSPANQAFVDATRRQYQDAATHKEQQLAGDQRPMFESWTDLGKSGQKGLLAGAAGTADLLKAISDVAAGPNGNTPPPMRFDKPFRDPATGKIDWSSLMPSYDTPVMDAAQRNFPETLGYQPKGQLGDYLQTAGEMAPGMLFPAGPAKSLAAKIGSRALRNVVAPAVGSETAGDIAHRYYPELEDKARFFGGLGAGVLAAMPEAVVRSAIGKSASTGANLSADSLAYLKGRGITIPVSASNDLPKLRAIEGSTDLGMGKFSPKKIADDYNATIGADIGDPSLNRFTLDIRDPATNKVTQRGTLSLHGEKLGEAYNKLSQGVDVSPMARHVDDMDEIISAWGRNNDVSSNIIPSGFADLTNKFESLVTSGKTISAEDLRNWRTQMGVISRTSTSKLTAQSAQDFVKVLDDALYTSLENTGQASKITGFKELNRYYRNFLATKAAAEASPEGAMRSNGIIDPRTMEKISDPFGLDPTETLNATARKINDSQANLGAPNQVVRTERANQGLGLSDIVQSAIPALSYPFFTGTPIGLNSTSAALAAAALVGSNVLRFAKNKTNQAGAAFLASDMGQKLAKQLAETRMTNPIPAPLYAATADQREGRKSGGRVSPHDADADQLVRAAERAKKGWSAETEPLLKQSDEAVAHALEVANRSI